MREIKYQTMNIRGLSIRDQVIRIKEILSERRQQASATEGAI